jgi:hypothetical protein
LSFANVFRSIGRICFVHPALDDTRQIKAERQIGRDKTPPSFVPPQTGGIGQNSSPGPSSNFQRSVQHRGGAIIEIDGKKANTFLGHQPYCHAIQGASGEVALGDGRLLAASADEACAVLDVEKYPLLGVIVGS